MQAEGREWRIAETVDGDVAAVEYDADANHITDWGLRAWPGIHGHGYDVENVADELADLREPADANERQMIESEAERVSKVGHVKNEHTRRGGL